MTRLTLAAHPLIHRGRRRLGRLHHRRAAGRADGDAVSWWWKKQPSPACRFVGRFHAGSGDIYHEMWAQLSVDGVQDLGSRKIVDVRLRFRSTNNMEVDIVGKHAFVLQRRGTPTIELFSDPACANGPVWSWFENDVWPAKSRITIEGRP